MVGCSAPNCANKTEKGFRLSRFPTNEKRKAIWLQNCRRDKWKPTSNSRLCEDTTPSEIAGGATITENETANLGVGNGTALSHEAFPAGEEEQIKQLNNEVASLKEELQKKDSIMKSFLNNEQIAALQQTPNKWSAESTLLGLKLRFSQGVSIFYFTNC
ncbi:uncharacterized protein LOC120351386 isoform X2 [Nilaparvata lugens]|uniref:uncharacterized protein LOC120351386 isoform X2 n=1 Tax=Nilaparvata lugens TaxID=108931 RepID=UPI00193D71C3|nr:uncharacterized protein LOC120351386 isoform X2 [Nilaparvata lugens]